MSATRYLRNFHFMTLLAVLGLAAMPGSVPAQQAPDSHADVTVASPAFKMDAGPVVAMDGGHHNFHTVDKGFAPLARLLRNDGFRVVGVAAPFSSATLNNIDVLVISNALNAVNERNWALPTPSAFTSDEIAAVKAWVKKGGALLLIADHFPFAGAAASLAEAFGFTFINGFALNEARLGHTDIFTRASGTLRNDVVTRGRSQDESVNAVATFTGSAFQAPPRARPLIQFPEGYTVLMPEVAWEFNDATPRRPATGYLQGAVMPYGRGRVAVFGEAAMFTAQVSAGTPPKRLGFNAPEAPENKQFALNVVRWLAGVLPR